MIGNTSIYMLTNMFKLIMGPVSLMSEDDSLWNIYSTITGCTNIAVHLNIAVFCWTSPHIHWIHCT